MKVTGHVVSRMSAELARINVYADDNTVRRMLEAALADEPPSEGVTELVRRLTHAQQKLERVRQWRNSDDGKYALPRITELDAILEEP